MDELTLLRSTRDDTLAPSARSLTAGRAALLERIAADTATDATGAHAAVPASPATHLAPRRRGRRPLRRITWVAAGAAAALTGALVVGNVSVGVQSAQASEILRTAAANALTATDAAAAPGQYVRSLTHARWLLCVDGNDPSSCAPNDQTLDVYKPVDPSADWVLVRDWGRRSGMSGASVETTRAADGRFYGPESSWERVDPAEIPTDGAAAYAWIDGAYQGGSASRDEDDFVRIADILRSGLVPAPQRAALLDALSRIPGVASTADVANLDGVKGVAIGRNEPFRGGERQEIIIDPSTGLVIGERTVSGGGLADWFAEGEVTGLTAITTTVVDSAP